MPAPSIQRTTSNVLHYRIDRWGHGGRLEEEAAFIGDLQAARAAFQQLVERYPDRLWTLRQGARLIAEHPERTRP
jgi:hypothetical protein